MIGAVIGKKIEQTQKFLENGIRIPVTVVYVPSTPVVAVKTKDKHGYTALQVAFGVKKVKGRKKKAGEEKTTPLFLREIKIVDGDEAADVLPKVGDMVQAADVLKPGDLIDVTGVSKGKGFAGGVKRYHFKGGPRTHGQSDRERAPGSIGQTTTPGRVYKGKRMAGHMGVEQVTVKNLLVVSVEGDRLFIKGLVPGSLNTILTIKKAGEYKKFVPLYQEAVEVASAETAPEQVVSEAEVSIEEEVQMETPVEEKIKESVAQDSQPAESAEKEEEMVGEEKENA